MTSDKLDSETLRKYQISVSVVLLPSLTNDRSNGAKVQSGRKIFQIRLKIKKCEMTKSTIMKDPVKPLEPVTKCTGCNALSYQINHSNRRLARLGEKLRRKGRRYGSEVQIKI